MKSANPSEQSALIPATPQGLQNSAPSQVATVPNVAEMLQAVIKGGVSNENVAALEKLVGLYERMQDRDAEKAFNAAFVKMQGEIPVIVASSMIPNRGKYEKFEDLMKTVGPILRANGFSISFSQPADMPVGKIVETCHLAHMGGHSRQHTCAVRVRRADNETQSDTMAMTTAKRNALIQALNLVIRQDCLNEEHDAGIIGDPNAKVSPEVAEELEHRVKMTNSDAAKFLAFAGADKFSNILESKYAMLDASLKRRETQGR